VVAFGASIGGSFHLDDYSLFSQDLWRPFQVRPLTYVTFWINHQLGGQNPIGYHAVNLALHLVAVVLLWRCLGRLIPARAAFIATAIFAVHPLVAEPVNYVFERSTLLETVFCLAALLAWTRRQHWLATLWFAAALLSKEECVTFPLFLLLLYLTGPRDRRALSSIVGMLALALVAGIRVLIAGASARGSGIGSQAGISAVAYLLTQGIVILRYLRLLILPWGFTVDPDIRIVIGPLAWFAWAAIVALAWVATRRFSGRREGFWLIAGLLLLLPSSSIFPAADLAADRRMYLPLIAFSAALGIVAGKLRSSWAIGSVLATLAILSFARTLVWQSEESLWSDAVAKAPGKTRPRIQLARSVGGARGLEILEAAKSLAPDDPAIASEEGRIALDLGRPRQALLAFGRALALEPGLAAAHNNRGVALLLLGQTDAARADFERALAIDPCQFDARLNLRRLGIAGDPPPSCVFSVEQKAELVR
jgi:protein O-mannosyl-transferase